MGNSKHSTKPTKRSDTGTPMSVSEREQLYLAEEMKPIRPRKTSKQSNHPVSDHVAQLMERQRLHEKYRRLFQEKFDYRRLVTYVPNKRIPIYNWFKFKEGYSRGLVFGLLNEFGIKRGDIVLDPFAGCGTTLLACKEFGVHAVGFDMLPVAVKIAQIKLMEWGNIDELIKAVDRLMSLSRRKPKTRFPDVAIVNKAFPQHVQDDLLFYKEAIEKVRQPVRDFLMLGLISILEEVSYTSKDGQFLRLVDRQIRPVKDALRHRLSCMIADLCGPGLKLGGRADARVEVFQGDARETCLPKRYWGKIGAVITSPPYLNRYDYSRTYALELCLLQAGGGGGLNGVRHSLLRSHIESRECPGREIEIPSLSEILTALAEKRLNNARIPIMIRGYFEDMNLVIQNLSRYVRRGGHVALVVANAQFEGEPVPTDLILSELAESHGFRTEKVWITRYKGNSSQQMAKYGRRPVRESIVFWKKR